MNRVLRLGTRGSRLALIQSRLIAERLRGLGHEVDLVPLVTEGDRRAPGTSPGEGMFVSFLERALLSGQIDLAVHSAKDMPIVEQPGLVVGAYPERADPRDVLVTRAGGATLDSLALGTTVGTDSPRRAAFVRCHRPDLELVPLHGNVDTRLRRLDEGVVGALVLAAAGLDRLGRGDRIDCRVDPALVPPAPAQGALAVQARSDDAEVVEVLGQLDLRGVRLAVEAERLVLAEVGGGCRSPVGALAEMVDGRLRLLAGAVGPRSSRLLHLDEDAADVAGAARLAASAGQALRAHLAEEITRSVR
jgi:hydroxymethylbilane synthase